MVFEICDNLDFERKLNSTYFVDLKYESTSDCDFFRKVEVDASVLREFTLRNSVGTFQKPSRSPNLADQ